MAKNNDTIWKFLRMAMVVGGVLVSIAIAYGALNQRVKYNSAQIKEHGAKIDANQAAVSELRTDVKYIVKSVDAIAEKMEIEVKK